VYVPCEVCKGARYNRETLEVHYKGRTIAEILDMPIEEAEQFFAAIPAIHRHLKTLVDVGLGYVRLGQPAPTLSGGEAQRVKLASELQKRSTGRTVYVLDEPTTGLHFEDIRKLLGVLHSLVDKGNTVIVIEHNLDVIKTADWVIEMGPEGGHKGGIVVGIGSPEEIAHIEDSATGDFLRPLLGVKPLAGGGEAVVRGRRASGNGSNGNGNGTTATAAANGNGNSPAKAPTAAKAAPKTAVKAAVKAPAKTAVKAAVKAAAVKAAPAKAAPAKTNGTATRATKSTTAAKTTAAKTNGATKATATKAAGAKTAKAPAKRTRG
jgi:excinuclease ABC subunit A